MSDLAGVLIQNRSRIHEIAVVLARYGFGTLAAQAAAAAAGGGAPWIPERLLARMVDPAVTAMTTGERVRAALTELGTTFVKFGQMLSQRPDIVGPEVATELTGLQTSVPADPPGLAERRVARELGRPLHEVFASFESVPMASGSVAQVHRASLLDGTAVVVKVLHDGADHRVLSDLELMHALVGYLEKLDHELAQYRPAAMVAEFDTMMRAAIDFRVELSSLQRFELNFASEPDLVIPAPYPEESGRGVLTMQLIEGHLISSRGELTEAGFDVDILVRRMLDAYLEMLFRDGLFHADPHPGNFLLEVPNRIAFLDFGDVGRLTSARRRQIEDLMLAVGLRDADSLTDALCAICHAPPTLDRERFGTDVDEWMTRYLTAGMGEFDVAGMISHGAAILHQHHLHLPSDLVLVFRVLVRLQGLAQSLEVKTSVGDALQPYLSELLQHRFDPRRIAQDALRTLRGWDRLMKDLPDDVRSVVHQLSRGEVAVDLRLHDPDRVMDQLVDGLVASSTLLAAALLWSRQADPVLRGISIPGALTAVVGAGTWIRLVRARRERRRDGLTRTLELARTVRRVVPRRTPPAP